MTVVDWDFFTVNEESGPATVGMKDKGATVGEDGMPSNVEEPDMFAMETPSPTQKPSGGFRTGDMMTVIGRFHRRSIMHYLLR